MTTITIPLIKGYNYISFPATSIDNFRTIFTISGIIDNKLSFRTYDPILQTFIDINDYEYIEQGRGYIIELSLSGAIIYDGIEYTLIFNQLKSKLLEGWNLVGPGSISIIPKYWCEIKDSFNFPVTVLEPKRAYWINYNHCIEPKTDPILIIATIGLGISILSLLISIRTAKAIQ